MQRLFLVFLGMLFCIVSGRPQDLATDQAELKSHLKSLARRGIEDSSALSAFAFSDAWEAIRSASPSLEAVAVLAALKERGLDEVPARLLLATLAQASRIPENANDKRSEARLQRVFSGLLSVYRLAPRNQDVLELVDNFLHSWRGPTEPLEKRFYDSFSTVADLENAALALADSDLGEGRLSVRAFRAALARQPNQPLLLLKLVDGRRAEFDIEAKIAILEAAYREAARIAEPKNNLRLVIAQRWIAALLEAGLAGSAIDILNSFPADLRRALERGEHGTFDLEWKGLSSEFDLDDIALDIASAYLLEGRMEEARDLLKVFPGAEIPLRRTQSELGDPQRSVLQLGLAKVMAGLESPIDDFDFVASFFTDSKLAVSGLDNNALRPLPWELLLARHLRTVGGDGLADALIRHAAADFVWEAPPTLQGSPFVHPLPPFLQDAGLDQFSPAEDALRDRRARQRDLLRKSLGKPGRLEPVNERIARLLARPANSAFREVAETISVGHGPPPPKAGTVRGPVKPDRWPAEFESVARARKGDHLVAIGSSQSLDPTGEVSPGGYWIVHSSDGGGHWERPLYTGLQAGFPYVIPEGARLEILDGDRFRVEADIREIDTSLIMFPPIATPIKRSKTGLVLESSLSLLALDSDGDGLTDLIEERIACDPFDPDTDGDGIPDGVDGLPQVGQAASDDPRVGAWQALLEALGGNRGTLFLVADRDDLRGVRTDRRTIVLSEEELKKLEAKRGPTYSSEVSVAFFDKRSERMLAVWTARWTGGTYKLTRVADKWTIQVLSWWIT